MDQSSAQPSPTVPPPPPIPEQPKSNYQKPLIGILALLIVIILGVAGYFYFQNQELQKKMIQTLPTTTPFPSATTDPTANWKTYINNQIGISFSYPQELIYSYDKFTDFISDKSLSGNLLIQNFDGSRPRQEEVSDFQIAIFVSKDEGKTLEQYAQNAGSKSMQKIKVGGLDAIKGASIQKNTEVPTIWVKSSSNLFTIQFSNPKSINSLWFDQILSTVKFTN